LRKLQRFCAIALYGTAQDSLPDILKSQRPSISTIQSHYTADFSEFVPMCI
jgi:hypothetical protein